MKNKNLPVYELAFLLLGELAVSLIVCGVYLIIDKFTFQVVCGAALGSLVSVLNFLFLIITTNRAIDKAMAERGDGEMDGEAAAEFAKKHQAGIQAAVKLSYIVRSFTMIAALVASFLIDGVFDVIATLIPLVMLRPLLTLSQIISARRNKNG